MGCNFCTTSAFFGGKGKFLNFYQTGEELFKVMCEMESSMKVRSFFMMDENFLLHRKRAMELLELMKAGEQGLGAVCVFVGQCDQQVYDAGAGGIGHFVDLDGPGIGALELLRSCRGATRWR